VRELPAPLLNRGHGAIGHSERHTEGSQGEGAHGLGGHTHTQSNVREGEAASGKGRARLKARQASLSDALAQAVLLVAPRGDPSARLSRSTTCTAALSRRRGPTRRRKQAPERSFAPRPCRRHPAPLTTSSQLSRRPAQQRRSGSAAMPHMQEEPQGPEASQVVTSPSASGRPVGARALAAATACWCSRAAAQRLPSAGSR